MIFDDSPIGRPEDDRYGIDPFARNLANSIEAVASAQGVVIGLNGLWGSGKSSAVNLVLHHPKPAQEAGKIKVVTFNPWWFAGSEDLTLAFFQALQAAFDKPKLDGARKAARWLGSRLARGGPVLGAALDLYTAGKGGRRSPRPRSCSASSSAATRPWHRSTRSSPRPWTARRPVSWW